MVRELRRDPLPREDRGRVEPVDAPKGRVLVTPRGRPTPELPEKLQINYDDGSGEGTTIVGTTWLTSGVRRESRHRITRR